MKVAIVLTEVGRGIGGRFTLQEMLIAAVERARDSTTHEFAFMTAGYNRYAEGSPLWRARRLAKVGFTLTLRGGHDIQDAFVGRRILSLRTPLERELAAAGVDLVFFPTWIEEVDLPFICQVLDLEHRMKPWFPEVSRGGEWEHRERYYRRYLPKATRVIVPGEVGREQVSRFYGVEPSNCLPLPHPTPDFALEAAERPLEPVEVVRDLDIDAPYLFYPAQFWPHKNHAAALDVLAELAARGHRHQLALVGSDKGHQDHVEHAIRERNLEQDVKILGFVDERTLVALYQHAHALLYLSRFGPENLPPLEALALGCPAVVADVPGAAEQFGDAAVIVDPADPGEVADAVIRLEDEGVRATVVARGRTRARSWTADDYLRGVIDFLDDFERERRLWA